MNFNDERTETGKNKYYKNTIYQIAEVERSGKIMNRMSEIGDLMRRYIVAGIGGESCTKRGRSVRRADSQDV